MILRCVLLFMTLGCCLTKIFLLFVCTSCWSFLIVLFTTMIIGFIMSFQLRFSCRKWVLITFETCYKSSTCPQFTPPTPTPHPIFIYSYVTTQYFWNKSLFLVERIIHGPTNMLLQLSLQAFSIVLFLYEFSFILLFYIILIKIVNQSSVQYSNLNNKNTLFCWNVII